MQELEVLKCILLGCTATQAAGVHGPKGPPRQYIYMPVSCLYTWRGAVCQPELQALNASPRNHQPVVGAVPVQVE
jgi:hypothetical protein